MKYHFRRKLQTWKTGNAIKAWHCIQVREQGKRTWTFAGDDDGPYKYETAELCDAKIAKLNAGELP